MGIEIERKFLVRGDAWRALATGIQVRQGYLCTDPGRSVRVRLVGGQAFLTVKGAGDGAARPEYEYEIPAADAQDLLGLCMPPLIDKTRYVVPLGGLAWEVDEFHGANQGLVIAECELESEDQRVDKPDWVGEEVTGDVRYYNSSLVARPFTTW